MKLTRLERWTLWNQYKILESVDPDQANHYQKVMEILESGYEFEYESHIQHIYDDTFTEAECKEVIHILDMFWTLQRAFDSLADKTGLSVRDVRFPGFDGNNETKQMTYARFLVEKEQKFDGLIAPSDLNSHMPSLEIYQRMIEAWDGLPEKHTPSKQEIQTVLAARVHPNNRRP